MSQTTPLISTLKRLLKKHGNTYADVAKCLDLSEASVKRLFSEQNLSLQRLDAVCSLLGIEISDLVREMESEHHNAISELNYEQEKEIASNLELMIITVYVLNRLSLKDILNRSKFTETECIQHLAHLDRLRIIELQAGNRIKLLVAANFKWLDNGPIMKLFCAKIEAEFFRSSFTDRTEKMVVLKGILGDSSNALFQRKISQLAADFDTLSKDDASLPMAQRKGYTFLLGLRSWNYERLFNKKTLSTRLN